VAARLRSSPVRHIAVLTLAAGVLAVLGGVVFWAANGDMDLTRAIAYGFWFAAAAVLVLMVLAGRKWVWRRTNLPVLEGWQLVASALTLTVLGAVIDVAGG
jgi:hypothetical protein